ncbi:amidohydrolase family protein [Acidobacteria bacterium AH-259-D05]|nr:amidohydrolase family protein [Acidobacteria bacterium AH-259-D05]
MRPKHATRLVFLLACLLVSAFQTSMSYGQQTGSRVVVLRGATLIDGLGNPPLVDVTVVVEGDKIKSILSGGDSDYPADATIIDVAGKFIIPGLIDTHVHWGTWMGEVYINHGVTSVMAQVNASKEERTNSQTSLSTPRVFHTGGRPQLSPSMTRQEVRQAIQEYLKNEPEVAWFPQFRENIREVYRWGAEQVHQAGLVVFSHTQEASESVDAGMDVAEHVWGFSFPLMSPQELKDFKEGRFLHWASYLKQGKQLDQMIQRAVSRGVYLNPTLVYEWGSLSPKAKQREQEVYLLLSNPDLSYFPKTTGEVLLLRHRQIKGYSSRYEHLPLVSKLSPEDLQVFQEARRNVQRFVKRYVQLGGKVISGTDAAGVATPGLAMHHEMELLVEAGLTPMEALQSSTSWAADMLAGIKGARGNQKVGSIQEGNFADLLILAANPLEDITNTKKIEGVMKGGKFIQFGYHPEFFTFSRPPRRGSMATPEPEISSISPHRVVEGSSAFEIVIEGAGFVTNSVVKVDGVSLATTFDGPRRLRATIPASFVEEALPDRFRSPGPDQNVGIFGDRSVSITVFNPPPTGGVSNSVSLIVQAGWHVE